MKLYNAMHNLMSVVNIHEKAMTSDWSTLSEEEKHILLQYVHIPQHAINSIKSVLTAYKENEKEWSKITIKQ